MKKTYIIPAVQNIDFLVEDGIMLVVSKNTTANPNEEVLTKEANDWDLWSDDELE